MTFWTVARVEQAARLWRDGASAAKIANALGGVSRNAVIGKVHRHPDIFAPRRGSREVVRIRERRPVVPVVTTVKPAAAKKAAPAGTKRSSSFGYQPQASRARKADPVAPSVQAMNIPKRPAGNYRHRDFGLDDSKPIAFSSLGRFQCAWPLVDFDDDDTGDMPCCGRPRRGGDEPNSSYCAEHAAISRGAA